MYPFHDPRIPLINEEVTSYKDGYNTGTYTIWHDTRHVVASSLAVSPCLWWGLVSQTVRRQKTWGAGEVSWPCLGVRRWVSGRTSASESSPSPTSLAPPPQLYHIISDNINNNASMTTSTHQQQHSILHGTTYRQKTRFLKYSVKTSAMT